MNNKTFLSLHSIIYAGFAIALFFLPTVMWPMYGVEINDKYAYFLSQHTSIFLGGIAAITWLLRDIEPSVSAKKLVQALVVTNMLGAIITLYAAFTGIFAGFGWSDPAFFSFLSILSIRQLQLQKS
ncbi:hypothetical protein F2Z80_09305 [Vibrio fortis]|uniref:Uncharacterized protein n=1 Tax=Vibrio fortis TaxID=212667 RepID=A0A5N3SB93_9VIBR|nr:hypothetical protein [Vibrio fortis]KAB0304120.1 hypothetical protein F2Z80_09305 [Vibrio fortis]